MSQILKEYASSTLSKNKPYTA